MKYIGKQVNGLATRNNFIRSMDIAANPDADAALAAYSDAWFSSTRKQYLNEAIKLIRSKSMFWPRKAFTDMLEEILADSSGTPEEMRRLAQDVDVLKSRFVIWSTGSRSRPISDEQITADVKDFEAKYKYRCPDTYRSCWMNNGAYVTLSYGIKYEGLVFPGCTGTEDSLALLKKLAMEIVADMDHDVDDRMFRVCHAMYAARLAGKP